MHNICDTVHVRYHRYLRVIESVEVERHDGQTERLENENLRKKAKNRSTTLRTFCLRAALKRSAKGVRETRRGELDIFKNKCTASMCEFHLKHTHVVYSGSLEMHIGENATENTSKSEMHLGRRQHWDSGHLLRIELEAKTFVMEAKVKQANEQNMTGCKGY